MASEVRASHILVNTEEEARDIKQKIEGGQSFGDMARQHSACPSKAEGGDLGYFRRGQMVPEFETAAFDAPVNAVTEPVRTQFGYHLILVTDKKD